MNELPSLNVVRSVHDLGPKSVAVCAYFAGDDLRSGGILSTIVGDRLSAALDRGEVRDSLFEVTLFQSDGSRPGALVVGGGNRQDVDPITYLKLAGAASRYLTGRGYDEIAWLDDGQLSAGNLARAVGEGAMRGAYDSALRKSTPRTRKQLKSISIVSSRDHGEIAGGLATAAVVGEASVLTRDLVNMPPNELTPVSLAWQAEELARKHGIDIEILDEIKMKDLGMGALLAVASGSAFPPRLICLRHGDPRAPTRLAFAGKGVTFDSGGLQIKTSEGMLTMKGDMGGAATVLGALVACSRLGLSDICIQGYIGAVENMPGGRAMRPGDVLTAMNGKTIEITSTDAEGRLVLSDVLSFAVQRGATHLVDVATLTGGARTALGSAATLATGSPHQWVQTVALAGTDGFEHIWPMPLYADYRRKMDSDIADMKNTGGREGSPLTAAAFLREFVGDVPWTHLDIAGTSFADESLPYQPKGATGAGLGTLVALVRRMGAEAKGDRRDSGGG
jgi:leucyl aminopeptidase